MLSPGKDHLDVPRDPKDNRIYRAGLLEKCLRSAMFRKGIIEMCRNDILFYINSFVWQFNPKKPPKKRVGPFITWDFQEAALLDRPETTGRRGVLWCYEHGRSAVIEKSREMGASWLLLIVQDWLCIFQEMEQTLNISRSADAVDSKSPNSLFWKLRFMHQYLPVWLRGEVTEEKMYIGYDRSGSVQGGEASTGEAGVGGRTSLINIDEFPLIKQATQVRHRTAGTSDCRFFTGTHQGVGTEFYNLTQSPELTKIVMHWTQHPDKKKGMYRANLTTGQPEILDRSFKFDPDYPFVLDGTPNGGPFPGIRSPWYDQKCKDIGSSRGVSMELDIDPKGAVEQFFDALTIRVLKETYCRAPFWEGDLEYDRETGRPKALVRRPGGLVKLWLNPDHHGKPPKARYAAGADVSAGSGATPSTISVANADTGEKIFEYANARMDPKDFGTFYCAVGWLFLDHNGMPALICWETPGPGMTAGKQIIALGYRNVYFKTDEFRLNPTISDMPGWNNTKASERDLLEDYRGALSTRRFVNRSEEAMDDCLNFKYGSDGFVEHANIASPNNPSGARINHGDMVIADAQCLKMIDKLGGRSEGAVVIDEAPFGSMAWRRALREERMRQEESWA